MNVLLVAAALTVPGALGCHAAPRQRPVEMGPVDTGAGSLEAVRRQLQGTWALMSLELYSPTGEKIAAKAQGRLQYDEYGNMSMQATVTEGPEVESSVLNLSGRVAIDHRQQTLRFEGITARTADEKRLDPKLATTHVRHYEFVGDLLKTTVKAADGSTTATATWKKVS